MSRTFSTKNASVESLKFSCRGGFSPKARQMRTMAFWLSPLAWAMVRVLQCVAWAGRVSSVRVMTASTFASVSLRGCPERGASPRAPSRPVRKRLSPLACRLDCHPPLNGHRGVTQTGSAIQDDPSPLRRALIGLGASRHQFKFGFLLGP